MAEQKSEGTSNKQLSTSNNVGDMTPQQIATAVNTGLGHVSIAATSTMNFLAERQKTRQKELEIKKEIAKSLTESINTFTGQVQALVQSQDKNFQMATNNFAKIVQRGMDSCSPQAMAQLKNEKIDNHRLYQMYLKKMDALSIDDAAFETASAKLEEFESKIDQSLKEQADSFRKQIKDSQDSFDGLLRALNLQNNMVVAQAIGLQKQMLTLFEKYLEIPFEKQALSTIVNSTVTVEEVKDDNSALSDNKNLQQLQYNPAVTPSVFSRPVATPSTSSNISSTKHTTPAPTGM